MSTTTERLGEGFKPGPPRHYGRRLVLDWRDRWTSEIDRSLGDGFLRLMKEVDPELDRASTRDLVFRQTTFQEKHLAPIVREWSRSEAERLLSAASADLIHQLRGKLTSEWNIAELRPRSDWSLAVDLLGAFTLIAAGLSSIPLIADAATER